MHWSRSHFSGNFHILICLYEIPENVNSHLYIAGRAQYYLLLNNLCVKGFNAYHIRLIIAMLTINKQQLVA